MKYRRVWLTKRKGKRRPDGSVIDASTTKLENYRAL